MYYPYLRGRQFELIALREYAQSLGDKNNIIPIIEPVKNTFNSMKLAIPQLVENDVKFALILNPLVGEIRGNKRETILEALENVLPDYSAWIPAFLVSNNYLEISDELESFAGREVMLICSSITDTSNSDFEALIQEQEVKYIVSKENRSLKRKLDKLKKGGLIRLDDNFIVQTRNSDYLNMSEEQFSEEHLYYKDDGFEGFSDYTVLSSEYKEGGAAPYAVSIHLSYKKENDEIWLKHFTSESNDDRANIQGKFSEAARKAVQFLDEKQIHYNSVDELRAYYRDSKYPGLGMVKKISIKHHLELVNDIL